MRQNSELEDAGDYSAYKLANYNSDVDDYDEQPKFAQLKVQPKKNDFNGDFEILPQSQFQSKNLNEALTDFNTKDWSKCNKVMKGEMTCYYCKDAKGATQEECMFVSASNPKNIKLERHESTKYDTNSRSPSSTSATIVAAPSYKSSQLRSDPSKKEQFARLRMGRPLVPTKSSFVEPLVTPASSEQTYKKTIKRTISHKTKKIDDYIPAESRAIAFESHIAHD